MGASNRAGTMAFIRICLAILTAVALQANPSYADATLRTIEGVVIHIGAPDPTEYPDEDPPCGPAPLYNFEFELERITTIASDGSQTVSTRVLTADGGCGRGSPPSDPDPVGAYVFEMDVLANRVEIQVDASEGGECCNHFDFTMSRPEGWADGGCSAGPACPNVWIDVPSVGASVGTRIVRQDYTLDLRSFGNFTTYFCCEIAEVTSTAYRYTTVAAEA